MVMQKEERILHQQNLEDFYFFFLNVV